MRRFCSFWLFPSLAVLLVYVSGLIEPGKRRADLLWLIPAGLVAWTLLEYGLHRFLFHINFQFRNPKVSALIAGTHLEHHAAPRDPDKLLVKPGYGLTVSGILFGLAYFLSRSFFYASGLMAGIWAGFLYYEAVHYRVHLRTAPSGFIAWQRRAHFYHHFTNRERCFGVTSPLWDYVFRTQRN